MGALRPVLIWLLVVVASGAAPVAALCIERGDGCGEMCARCWCKKTGPHANLRARCPCCEPTPGTAVVTLTPPAVLPADRPTIGPPPHCATPPVRAAQVTSLAERIPDPPPRDTLLS
jgi:hypothetical protein